MQTDSYCPFGLTFNSYSRENSVSQNYKFGGKELQDELDLGWFDFGARMYSPDLGRWFNIDMKSEILPYWSPYRYGFNNPLRFSDPDGKTEGERTRAINMAREYSAANRHQDRRLYGYSGWRNQVPGYKVDCSGLVDDAVRYSGVGHLKIQVEKGYNGVKNIVNQPNVREIENVNHIRSGDIFSIDNDGHTGCVTDIVRNEKGEVIGFNIIHSECS